MEYEIEPEIFNRSEISDHICDSIQVIDYKSLSYDNFFQNYLFSNIPCLIRNVTNNWEATHKWVQNGLPNLNYLQDKYGNNQVMVYNCLDRYFNSQKTEETTLNEYVTNYWNIPKERDKKLLYLKDWHLKLQTQNESFYDVPIYFASDWLNEYHVSCLEDDYRFVYMGPQNTWTPFHADVFMSFSWSANVCGRKKWIFLPPGEENKLRDNLGNLPYDIMDLCTQVKSFSVIQNAGEAIFVPSGWHHQVWNLEDTISINHNWVNACNIRTMWNSLNFNLKNVEKEIKHCKDMENFVEHCQVMLQALFGINHKTFFNFLQYITKKRIEMTQNPEERILLHGHKMGLNHVKFDLESLMVVLEEFLSFLEGCELNYEVDVRRTLEDINAALIKI